EVQRFIRDREGTRHLDHLALTDGQVPDNVGWIDAMAWENLIELGADQRGGALAPAKSLQGRMRDAGILGHCQIGAERQFLENAAYAELLCSRDGIGAFLAAVDGNPASIRSPAASQDVHERRLAGTIMADQSDAGTAIDRE